ncbi:DUF6542 domain-containing protein [Mycobacterium aquaticum]|uniref:DUF6542 domain-containing protein n=1 Tax=Mycobacterium aquaticum TaxID=1927124 RepID=A0A1X0B405_9MYCO|nr:DUF6542 domain-containing protein [Mycobacterium aquaticum]ORA37040.1 hypothetical protein BST13_10135 [Mycobacterium aquaticum]
MSGQRAQSAVPADHRSVYPKWPGVPWWGAVLLAVTATAIGFAFDAGSGDRELSTFFAVCYVLGCLGAVLAVRQSGVFTAVIQPPLILFVAVPGSYFLFHGGQLGGIKDLAINCGYPLIERFPLMLFTTAAVLLIGLARWYFALATRHSAAKAANTESAETGNTRKATVAAAKTGIVAAVTTKLSGLILRKPPTRRSSAQRSADEAPPRRRRSDRPQRSERASRAGRTDRTTDRPDRTDRPRRRRPEAAEEAGTERRATKRTTPPRPRPSRPPLDEFGEPVPERPRKPRAPRTSEPPLVPPAEARRRVRTQPREPRKQPPPERHSAAAHDRQPRRRRFDDYQPFEDPFEAPRNGNGSSNGRPTHHPVSRVRYRGAEDEDDRHEYRSRPRSSTRGRDNTWEYDS